MKIEIPSEIPMQLFHSWYGEEKNSFSAWQKQKANNNHIISSKLILKHIQKS